MSVQYIFDKIIEIMKEPNLEPSSETISYHILSKKGTIDPKNPNKRKSITLIGDDKVNKYLAEFQKLYTEMKIEKKLMSESAFRKTCEQAMFDGKFNEIDIERIIDTIELEPVLNIARVYGLQFEENSNTKQLGRYTMINKEHVHNYVREIIERDKINFDYNLLTPQFKYDKNDYYEFVYLAYETKARDNKFAHYLFEEEKEKFIRIVRYLVGFKDDRLYIDYSKNESFLTPRLQISHKTVTFGSGLTTKDLTINLKYISLPSDKHWSSKIWEITSKDKINKMQDRILKSIYWVGISLSETNNEIALTELAIAFESLLKQNESGGPTTSSIQGQISDAVAFLVGKTLTERTDITKKFRKFYAYRSSIVHGGITKNNDIDYSEYLQIFNKTLRTLLSDETFSKCQNIEQLIEEIDKIKYS